MGKVLAAFLVLSAIVAGVAMYYLQVYAFYEDVPAVPGEDVQLTALASAAPEPIAYDGFVAIDSDSSPLRYRACFETPLSAGDLNAAYVAYDNPIPNNAPGWFDCFDAQAIGAALEEGRASAYLGVADLTYGFDRVVAIDTDGNGFVWHQINACGQALFDGDPLPADCSAPPEANQ